MCDASKKPREEMGSGLERFNRQLSETLLGIFIHKSSADEYFGVILIPYCGQACYSDSHQSDLVGFAGHITYQFV
jgi:hypothetical protein